MSRTKDKEEKPIKKSYKDFSTRLSKAWHNQDLSQDDYDYQKYYNDNPEEAYRQLESIEKGGQGHFPDEGRSGIYKTSNHPTYPDLGANSWLNNDRIFNMSARQAVPENTDRVLDYLGYDLGYNKGGTKAMYNGAYQLPEVTITPNGNYTELIPNELGTGWMYRNRAGRFDDFNYDYVNRYEGNQKALGGNLFRNGSWMPNKQWRNRISAWEGSSMYRPAPDTGRVNSSFQAEASRFLSVLPKKALQKLPEQAINALYSYSYNVGAGNFKKRVVPVLNKYLDGKASLQQVTNSMYATKDSQLRGLQKRRRYERGAFEAAITGKDLTGTNAYQQYDPLTGNYQSSNSPATKRRNIQWTDTINLNDGSLIQPNQQAPSLMQQLAHSEEILAEANKRINQVTTRMMPDAQSNDPYINAVYNSSIQDERNVLTNDVKDYVKNQFLLEHSNDFLSNIEYQPYQNNIFKEGGKMPSINSRLTFRSGIYNTPSDNTQVQPKISEEQLKFRKKQLNIEAAKRKKERAAVNRELEKRRTQQRYRIQTIMNLNSKDPNKRFYSRAALASSNADYTQPKPIVGTTTKNTSLNTKKYQSSSNYRINKGDSLSKIALRSGIPISDIIKANPQISNINSINEGETIYLPKVTTLTPFSKEEILKGVDQRTPFEKDRNQYLISKKEQTEAEERYKLKLSKLSPYERKIQLLADEAENAANEAAISNYISPIRTKQRATDEIAQNPNLFEKGIAGIIGGIRAGLYFTPYRWLDPTFDIANSTIEGLNNFLIRNKIIEENGIVDNLLGSTHNALSMSSPSQNIASFIGDKVQNYDPTNYIGNGIVSSLQSAAFAPGPWQAKLAGAIAGLGSSTGGQYQAEQGNELASLFLYATPTSMTNAVSKVMSSPGFAAANRVRKTVDGVTRGLATAAKDTALGVVGSNVADMLGMSPEEKMGVMAITQMLGDKVKIKGKNAQQYIESISPVKDRINDVYFASQGNPSPRALIDKYLQYRKDKKAGVALNEYTGTTIDSNDKSHQGKYSSGYGTDEGIIYTDHNGKQVKVVTGRDVDVQQEMLSRTSQDVTFNTTTPIWSYVSGKLALRPGQTAHYADADIAMRRLDSHDIGYDPKNPSKNVVYEITPTKLKATDIGAELMGKENEVQNSRNLREQLLKQGYTEMETHTESWYNSDRARNKGTTTVIQKNGGIVQSPIDSNLKGAIRQITTYKNPTDRTKDVIIIGGNDLAQPGSQRMHYAVSNDSNTNARTTTALGISNVDNTAKNYYTKYTSNITPIETNLKNSTIYSPDQANAVLSEVAKDLVQSVKVKDSTSLYKLLLSYIPKINKIVPTKGISLPDNSFKSDHKSYKTPDGKNTVFGVTSSDLKRAIKDLVTYAKSQVEQSETIGIKANQQLNAKARAFANSVSYRVRTDLGSIKYTRAELQANLPQLKKRYNELKKGDLKIEEEKLTSSEIDKLKAAGYAPDPSTHIYSLKKEKAAELGVGGEFMQPYLDDTQILENLIKFAEN